MKQTFQSVMKRSPASARRATPAPVVTSHPNVEHQDVRPREAHHCSCGGTCPRCQDGAGAGVEKHTGSDHRDEPPAALTGTRDRGGAPEGTDAQQDDADWDLAGGFGSLIGPPQFTVSAGTRTGPTFSSCRGFNLIEDWSTTGRNGFIVQEITNTGSITQCDGTSVTPPNTPHYWEAWPVDGSGTVGDGGADLWFRAARPATSGSWSMTGNVGFVDALDPAAGFSRTAVPDANGLLATTTDPNNLFPATLTRHKAGVWSCCGGDNFHREA